MRPLQRKPPRQICAAGKAVTGLAKSLNALSQGWLWLGVILMPILAMAGGLGFQATGCVLGFSALAAWVVDRKGADYLKAAWPFWLIGFLAWACISTIWSPYEAAFWGGGAFLLVVLVIPLLFAPAIVLKTPERLKPALVWTVICAGVMGVVLILMDAATGYALSLWADPVAKGEDPVRRLGDAEMNLGRGQVSYVQLLWPMAVLLILRMKRSLILVFGAFLGLALSAYLNNLSIVLPTLILAGGLAALAWVRPSLGLVLAFSLAIASLGFAPLLGLCASYVDVDWMRNLPLSWEHRLRMWDYSWQLIQQAPLFGHGFDSARVFDDLTFRAPDGRDITVMSMHPHNIGLQIWLETGFIGVLLAVGFLAALLKAMLNICTGSAPAFAVVGLVVSIAASGAATVGVWQHWWWALIIFTASLLCLMPENVDE